MDLAARQKDSHRDGLPVEFPLKDSQGLFVIKDRRRVLGRQKAEQDYNDLKVILLKKRVATMKRLIFISLIVGINVIVIFIVYALIVAIKN